MTQVINHKTNFTAGAVSMDLLGRTDLSAYDNGALELKNMFISPIGGIERRSGLRYVDTINDAVRLIAFEFNTEQTYLCVVGNNFIKVYKNEILHQTLTSPWSATDIAQLRWTQSADTLLLTHPHYAPRKIMRQSDETFVLSEWSFDIADDGRKMCPFEKFADANMTMSLSGDAYNVTLTTSDDFFVAHHVGVRIRLKDGEYLITSIVDSKNAVASVKKSTSSASATTNWSEEAFSAARGYPICVTFYQGRLVIGGSRDLPNKLWFSKTFHIMNFDTGTGLDDEAIGFSLLSDQVNAICGLMSGRHLQVFTSGSEWMVSGDPLTPQSIQLKRQTKVGSPTYRYVPPVDVSGATLFASQNGREVREFLFADLEQAYQSKNVSLLSHHLINYPIDMDYDAARRLVYVLMSDGSMATLTNYRSEDVLAWSHHETAGEFLSVGVVGENVYFLIRRGNEIYLETFDNEVLTDCAFLGESQTSSFSWSGLTPLVGKKVYIVADGRVEKPQILSTSTLVLEKGAKKLEVGLPYEHTIIPLPPTVNASGGPTPLKAVRLVELRLKVVDTTSVQVNVGSGYEEHLVKKLNDKYVLGGPSSKQSKDVIIRALGWIRDGISALWQMKSDAPQSCKVVSVTSVMKVSD